MAQEFKVKWPLAFLPPIHLRLPQYSYPDNDMKDARAQGGRFSSSSHDRCSEESGSEEASMSSTNHLESDADASRIFSYGSEHSFSSHVSVNVCKRLGAI